VLSRRLSDKYAGGESVCGVSMVPGRPSNTHDSWSRPAS